MKVMSIDYRIKMKSERSAGQVFEWFRERLRGEVQADDELCQLSRDDLTLCVRDISGNAPPDVLSRKLCIKSCGFEPSVTMGFYMVPGRTKEGMLAMFDSLVAFMRKDPGDLCFGYKSVWDMLRRDGRVILDARHGQWDENLGWIQSVPFEYEWGELPFE